ncbi:DUF2269 domain-containing protein [Sulfitobacter sp. SK011]|uniref:DUF2269 family protein n=1 Tax=Sulfitobacter sp. SK011 TaxID=1389004 RepID=UPI000E0A0AA2|nr:DUF2269 domain-containing protein [Sulfitobacter sp. SK011]AXI41953.1 DUF2269 domain-containing protein [Sulfitobacter sp. SK011]
MIHDLLLFAHVIGAAVLLGTGAGIAFFMFSSQRSQNPALIAHVAGIVVVADWLFTATAAVAQPITGYFLAQAAGWPLTSGWLAWALLLYVFVGVFWLPVIWIQKQLRDLAQTAAAQGAPLPPRFHRLYRIWFACGFPAFAAVLAILWLMITKPTF